jgi:uncharacterized protein YwgA
MEKKDFLLLVVAAGEGKSLTPVQLQKTLFLIERAKLPETPKPFYEFEPYHYGPFDKDIYSDAVFLDKEGFVAHLPSDTGTWLDTVITLDGSIKAASLKKGLSPSSAEFIAAVVRWAQPLSFSDLVGTIYKLFPEYRQNSVFQS